MQSKIDKMKKWIQKKEKMLINGSLVQGKGNAFKSINPSDQSLLCEYSMASNEDVNTAVASSNSAFLNRDWQKMTRQKRASILQEISKVIQGNAEDLAIIETLSNGKTYLESLHDDLPDSSRVFDYYAGWIDKVHDDVLPVEKNFMNYTRREALGVCALIVPWNFPLLMACWKIAPALAMGNTVLIKPSEYTPYSLLYAFEKCYEKNILPKGVVNIIVGDAGAGEILTTHNDVHGISFTGSTAVGRKIVEASSKSNLKKVNIELGGKSPNIFFEDTPDLDSAIKRQYPAMFSHKGEKCSEPTRLIVHENIYKQVLSGLKKLSEETVYGDPFDKKTTHGAQCHQDHFDKIMSYIEDGKSKNIPILFGGEAEKTSLNGLTIQPTTFYDVEPNAKIAQDEIFGPVLCVHSFKDEEEAIEIANNTNYGLAAGFYTSDINRAHRVAAQIDAGQIFINHYGCYDFSSPFGGFKQSGWGKAMAKHSLDEYTKTKSIWIAL